MNHADQTRRQDDVLERVLEILSLDPHVLGVLYSGSLARGTQDAFSDLDVSCYLRDEHKTGREELYDAVGNFAPTLCRMWLYDRHALVLFESGVRLDLDFFPRSALERLPIPRDFKILHDPDGVLAQSAEVRAEDRSDPVEPPVWPPERGDYVDWFFWMFRQSYAWAKRGAQGDERSYEKLSAAIGSIQQIRDGLTQMCLWVRGRQDYLEVVDPSLAHRLSATFTHLDADEICSALRVLLDEFERVSESYCARKGRDLPKDKFGVVRRIFDELDQLS